MNKFIILLLLFTSTCFAYNSNQITLVYSERDSRLPVPYYSALYVDILNEKVAEVFMDQFKHVQHIITWDSKAKDLNYIDYKKKVIFKSTTQKILKEKVAPTVKYLPRHKCTIYFYKESEDYSSAKCFQEHKVHFEFREVNMKKYQKLVFEYLEQIGPTLDKIGLLDSIVFTHNIKYKIKDEVVEWRKRFSHFNFQVMGRNGLKLPLDTRLTRLKPQNCFYTECFGQKLKGRYEESSNL